MRCHTDALNSSKTLDNLCAGLLKEGYVSSCQSLYLRLILSRANNTEGKQHVQPVPVKFHKAQDNIQNRHTDEDLAFATTGFLWDIFRLFVSKRVCSFSRWQNKGTNQCNSSNQASTTHNVCLMKFDCQTTTLWSPSNKLNFPSLCWFQNLVTFCLSRSRNFKLKTYLHSHQKSKKWFQYSLFPQNGLKSMEMKLVEVMEMKEFENSSKSLIWLNQ